MSDLPVNPLAKEFYSSFYRDEPEVLLEKPDYAILYKPHFMHSAPLREGEGVSLLSWYLSLPKTPSEARAVLGKKPVERGLLHRLDFATAGIVLVAKNQNAYSFLYSAQRKGRFTKEYRAFCDCTGCKGGRLLYKAGMSFCVKSRFRAFGTGGKEVRPVFEASSGESAKKKKRGTAREYVTNVAIEDVTRDGKGASVLCSLSLGFRHQVRAHLASIGLPICADALYNPLCKGRQQIEGGNGCPAFMQLVACRLTFPDPASAAQVSFSLPPANKKSP